jgi:hypothetical protein
MTRTRRERKTIEPGIYLGNLREVKTIQVNKDGEKKTKILFVYYIAAEDAEVVSFFNPSLADTSWLVKFLKSSCGNSFTAEHQATGDKMWAFIQSLVGRDWNLVVTLSNGYNNVQSAVPVKEKKATPVSETEDVTFTFNDDQIPF